MDSDSTRSQSYLFSPRASSPEDHHHPLGISPRGFIPWSHFWGPEGAGILHWRAQSRQSGLRLHLLQLCCGSVGEGGCPAQTTSSSARVCITKQICFSSCSGYFLWFIMKCFVTWNDGLPQNIRVIPCKLMIWKSTKECKQLEAS